MYMKLFSPLKFIFQNPIYNNYSIAIPPYHIPINYQIVISDTANYSSYPRRQENFVRRVQYVAPSAGLHITEQDIEICTDVVSVLKGIPPNKVYIVIQDTEAYKG